MNNLKTPFLFYISGYFKDDKTEFYNYKVCTFDDLPEGIDDNDIFMFGISEDEINECIIQGANSNHYDFVITSYSLCSFFN